MKRTLFPGFKNAVVLDDVLLYYYIDDLRVFLKQYLAHLLVYHNQVDAYEYPNEFHLLTDLHRVGYDALLLYHDYPAPNSFIKQFYRLVLPREVLPELECTSNLLKFQASPAKQQQVLRMMEFLKYAGLLGKQLTFVEIGAGKGYLSAHLVNCGETTVSVEASLKHAYSWAQRTAHLKVIEPNFPVDRLRFCSAFVCAETSVYNVIERAESLSELQRRLEFSDKSDLQKQNPNSPIYGLCATQVLGAQRPCDCVLVGLHACGSLSTSMLRLAKQARAVVTVPCCFSHIQRADFLFSTAFKSVRTLILETCALLHEYNRANCQIKTSAIGLVPNHFLTQDGYIRFETYKEQIEAFRKQNCSENCSAFAIYCAARQMLGQVVEAAILVDRMVAFGAPISSGLHGASGKGYIYCILRE